VLLEEQEAHYI